MPKMTIGGTLSGKALKKDSYYLHIYAISIFGGIFVRRGT